MDFRTLIGNPWRKANQILTCPRDYFGEVHVNDAASGTEFTPHTQTPAKVMDAVVKNFAHYLVPLPKINIVFCNLPSCFDAQQQRLILSKRSASKEAVAAFLRMNTFAKTQDYFLETALAGP